MQEGSPGLPTRVEVGSIFATLSMIGRHALSVQREPVAVTLDFFVAGADPATESRDSCWSSVMAIAASIMSRPSAAFGSRSVTQCTCHRSPRPRRRCW